MIYSDGRPVRLGERVRLWGSKIGIVVCSIDDDRYSESFSCADWAHLDRGFVVKTEDGEVFHCDEPDEDFEVMVAADRCDKLPIERDFVSLPGRKGRFFVSAVFL
jgi:hypothetical protein